MVTGETIWIINFIDLSVIYDMFLKIAVIPAQAGIHAINKIFTQWGQHRKCSFVRYAEPV